MKYNKKELCLIWLDSFIGLEYKHKRTIYNLINDSFSIYKIIEKNKDYISTNIGEKEYNTLLQGANDVYLDYVIKGLNDKDICAITIESHNYPQNLKNTPIPPLILYAKGDISLLNNKCFSIVGSRKSLPLSISIAKDYATHLSKSGFTLVTGIAEGIDSTVLESCFECNGKVISVLAGGFDNIYPASNKHLFDKICKYGLAISEYPPDFKAQRFNFPIRNRIIAGIGIGTLIVSGGLKSGTLYTAEYAEEYSKDLFAIPYNVNIASGAGCNELIKRGAILTDTPQDILSFYGIEEKDEQQELSELEQQFISVIGDGEHIDTICKKLNKKIYEIIPIITMLEIKGLIIKVGVNKYGLSKKAEE